MARYLVKHRITLPLTL